MNAKRVNTKKMRAWTGIALVLAVLALLCLTAGAQETADEWVKKGNDLYQSGESLQEALDAYEKALQMDSENNTILMKVALIHDILGIRAASKALGIIEKKLEKNPGDAASWWARGGAMLRLGMKDDANKSFEKALDIYDQEIQRDQNNGTAWWYKAETLVSLSSYENALKAYDKVIELAHPRKKDALNNKGAILMDVFGKFNESIAAYDEAIEIYPEDFSAWVGKAITLEVMGRNAESEVAYTKAKELGYRG